MSQALKSLLEHGKVGPLPFRARASFSSFSYGEAQPSVEFGEVLSDEGFD